MGYYFYLMTDKGYSYIKICSGVCVCVCVCVIFSLKDVRVCVYISIWIAINMGWGKEESLFNKHNVELCCLIEYVSAICTARASTHLDREGTRARPD